MSLAAYYALPDAPPTDGDPLASNSGWLHWSNFVMARADRYPALAHLGGYGWTDQLDDAEHELEQLLHDTDSDQDLTAITAQVLAALRARPDAATVFYASDGEPAGEDDTATESADPNDPDPLAVLTEGRVARKEGETWQVGQNHYTKINGKIRKTSDPSKRAANQSKVKTRHAQRAAVKDAADRLAAGGKDLTADDVVALDDHFSALPRDRMREIARQIGAKVGGLKAQLAERLIAEAKARVAAGQQQPPAPEPPAPEPPPPKPDAHPAQVKIVNDLNAAPGLSDGQRKYYGWSMARVLGSMPKAALDRVHANLGSSSFYPRVEDIGPAVLEELVARSGSPERQADTRQKHAGLATERVGGIYLHGGGPPPRMFVDGDQDIKHATGRHAPRHQQTAERIYAHELGHAIDGPAREYSGSDEWNAAWAAEIDHSKADRAAGKPAPLTWYAASKPSEGFAEFSALVNSGQVPHAQIAAEFPLCTALWKAKGLWPSTERTDPKSEARADGQAPMLSDVFDHAIDLDDNGAHADVLLDPLDPAAAALALAQLRAEGDDEAAAEVLHMLGESDADDQATESVVREEHGAPPFPGAVFDTTSHRWKLPAHDATDHTGAHPAETKAKSLASRIGEVPAALVSRVAGWVKAKHDKLAARYGKTGARAILAGMILLAPTPVPGSSFVPIALAEAVLRLRRAVAGSAAESTEPQLTPDQVEEIARQLLTELEDEMRS